MSQGEQNPWLENLFRPLVIGLMFACISFSLVGLVRLFFPAWNGTYLTLVCILAALEAHYSYRLIRARSLRGGEMLRFRLVEIAIFFLLVKIGGYFGDSWVTVMAEVRSWPGYLYRLFDLETMAAFTLAVLSWHVSTQTSRDFERLNEPPVFHRYYVPPMESLTGRFFWGGAILLFTAGLTRIGIAQLLNLRRPSVPGLVLNVLVYFLLGLVILGQVRFATLHKRWEAGKIKVAEDLPRRWVRYSLALIGLAACLAFLLPTGYTLGLLEVLGWTLSLILGILAFAATLLFWLILLPFAWLLSLLGIEPISPDSLQRPVRPLSPGLVAQESPAWFQVLRSLVFWAIAVGMIFYVVRGYLRDHPELLEGLARLRLFRALRYIWAALRRWLRGWGSIIQERLPTGWTLGLRRSKQTPRQPFSFFRLGGLSPRAQVLYYYLSVLQRAARQGFPRQPAQTPLEYRGTLESSLPAAREDMELLTYAFIEARYSQHPVEAEDARRIRMIWQRVKGALQALKRARQEEAP
ncbi:MAG: hypothetical protein Kow0063_26230 [Anaerolineae bacterium]